MRHSSVARRVAARLLLLAPLAAACRADGASGPASDAAVAESSVRAPGRSASAPGHFVSCSRRAFAADSAVIGPRGGVLVVGGNRLVIPAGALTAPTLIAATVPADTLAAIHFEPSGLQFNRPALLVMDVEGCAVPGDAPDIVYVNDEGDVLERIEAVYSRWLKAVAAPIEHFSAYQVAV